MRVFPLHTTRFFPPQTTSENRLQEFKIFSFISNPISFQDLTRLYDIPFVRDILSSEHRAVYPASWLWSMDEAATVIQKCTRGYAVRRDREVKEMRRFWEIIKEEEGEI
jgi:hypothetical protein